jgi:mRNA-degrading endonuclease YafQ of YafQ-DinJ toxin-antitoxin module
MSNNETKYTVKPTSRFRKDYKTMEKRNEEVLVLSLTRTGSHSDVY